jgi:fatty-acyl-CoA synthase
MHRGRLPRASPGGVSLREIPGGEEAGQGREKKEETEKKEKSRRGERMMSPDKPAPGLKHQFSIDWLDYHARYNAETLAVVDVDTNRSFTYREFNSRLKRLASSLKSRYGISKGDRVAVLAQNSTDVFELLFACWEVGAALMPLNFRLSAYEIAEIIADGEPSVIIFDAEFTCLVEGLDIHKVERAPEGDGGEYEALIEAGDGRLDPIELTIDDLGTLLYTSGTTGRPKGVIGTFRMMRDTIIHAAMHGEMTSSSRSLTCAPLFHSAGLYGFSMPVFHYGGTLHVMKEWDPVRFLYLLADPEIGITHTIGVPVQYSMVSNLREFKLATFPALRVAGVGAAPVPRDLLETWAARGVNLTQVYGLTEAFSVAILPPHKARDHVGSAGHRMLHTRLRIFDRQGKELPPGEVGEIRIRGPAVTPGYWRNPEETEKAFENGWFKTGDAGRVEEDGTIYIVDRYKDMYISGGENVYPAEVENALNDLLEVAAVAVVGVDDEKWGQTGLAVVQLRPECDLSQAALLEFCSQRLARYKIPRHVRFVGQLPMNAQGKMQKDEIKRLYDPNAG